MSQARCHHLVIVLKPQRRDQNVYANERINEIRSRMLEAFLPASATRVVVYLEPISMRSGPERLRKLCTESIGLEPDSFTAFVFTNKARDCLLLFSTPRSGDQVLVKKLEKGAFLLPAPEGSGTPFVIMRSSVLARLFR